MFHTLNWVNFINHKDFVNLCHHEVMGSLKFINLLAKMRLFNELQVYSHLSKELWSEQKLKSLRILVIWNIVKYYSS